MSHELKHDLPKGTYWSECDRSGEWWWGKCQSELELKESVFQLLENIDFSDGPH